MDDKTHPRFNWKHLTIDDPNLICEGLIGVEECTDYNLVEHVENGASKPIKRKVKNVNQIRKKQRLVNVEQVISPSKQGWSVDTHVEMFNDTIGNVTSWSHFGLPDQILKALSDQDFVEPTEIQSLTLPAAILGRKDIVGAAETGSGKTLAFGLPILTGIFKEKNKVLSGENGSKKPLYALILTPTRELAVQVKNHLIAAAKYLDINIAVIVGGMAAVKQERILSKGPEIVVATPGRLWELLQEGNSHLSQINNVKFLAIDETDRMLEKGHFEELHDLLERLNVDETKKRTRQNFVFSATLSLVHDLPKYLITKIKKSKLHKMTPAQKIQKIINILGMENPKIVDISEKGGTAKTLTESRVICNIDEKDYFVYYFLQRYPGRTLIFCNSIGCVKRLTNLLNILNCTPFLLHASMQQKQRLKNLERFRDYEHGILVATDVAARGLDIPKVEHVIHYQTPRTSESYVHRSGRTARASRQGITVLLIESSELPNYLRLCRTLNKTENLPVFPVESDFLEAIKERVHLARELDKLQLEIRKNNSEVGWLEKAAQEMDIIVDDFVMQYDGEHTSSQKKLFNSKKNHLLKLLAKPVFPKGFSGKYPLAYGGLNASFHEPGNTAVEHLKKSMQYNITKIEK